MSRERTEGQVKRLSRMADALIGDLQEQARELAELAAMTRETNGANVPSGAGDALGTTESVGMTPHTHENG